MPGQILDGGGGGVPGGRSRVKYAYQRPIFLQLFTEDEIQVNKDTSQLIFLESFLELSIKLWYQGSFY